MRLGRGPCESRLGKQLREQDLAFRDILKHWANTTSKGETQTKKTQGQKTVFCSHNNDLLVPQTDKYPQITLQIHIKITENTLTNQRAPQKGPQKPGEISMERFPTRDSCAPARLPKGPPCGLEVFPTGPSWTPEIFPMGPSCTPERFPTRDFMCSRNISNGAFMHSGKMSNEGLMPQRVTPNRWSILNHLGNMLWIQMGQ